MARALPVVTEPYALSARAWPRRIADCAAANEVETQSLSSGRSRSRFGKVEALIRRQRSTLGATIVPLFQTARAVESGPLRDF